MGLGGRDLIRSWAVPILLAGVALAFDAADRRVPFSVLATGALDEPAHLATGALGLLALSCFIDVPRRFYVAGLIASVAIDLDHILFFSSGWGTQISGPSRIPWPPWPWWSSRRRPAAGIGPCWPARRPGC